MQLKFIDDQIQELKDLQTGMGKFTTEWTGQPITTTDIDAIITDLNTKRQAIVDANAALSMSREEAHVAVSGNQDEILQVQSIAIGLHKGDKTILESNYNIHLRRDRSATPPPGTPVIDSIKDDIDGVGFILTMHGDNATQFHIYRASNEDSKVTVMPDSAFSYLNSTTKQTYLDDNLTAGVRYFYKIVGSNTQGKSAPSAVVSKVQ